MYSLIRIIMSYHQTSTRNARSGENLLMDYLVLIRNK